MSVGVVDEYHRLLGEYYAIARTLSETPHSNGSNDEPRIHHLLIRKASLQSQLDELSSTFTDEHFESAFHSIDHTTPSVDLHRSHPCQHSWN